GGAAGTSPSGAGVAVVPGAAARSTPFGAQGNTPTGAALMRPGANGMAGINDVPFANGTINGAIVTTPNTPAFTTTPNGIGATKATALGGAAGGSFAMTDPGLGSGSFPSAVQGLNNPASPSASGDAPFSRPG